MTCKEMGSDEESYAGARQVYIELSDERDFCSSYVYQIHE